MSGGQITPTSTEEALDDRDWGCMVVVPGFGLLKEDFQDAYLRIFDPTNGGDNFFKDGVAIKPFFRHDGRVPGRLREAHRHAPGAGGLGRYETVGGDPGLMQATRYRMDGSRPRAGESHRGL